MQNITTQFNAARWLGLFIFIHLLAWTLVPILVRHNLPLDSIEGSIWGHQLEWGYDKNPFLNGWLTALATYLGGQSGWMIYLFSQLSVVVCFLAVWQLAKHILPPTYALISVLLLEGIQYYNFHAIDFNDNTLELSLWALTSYFFYSALQTEKKAWYWILTGLFAGLGLMAKYYTAILLMPMALFLFMHADNRKQLTTLPPYLGLITFLIIIIPHIIWLFFHDFVTVTYVFERTSSTPSFFNHIFFPAQFAWQQFQVFLPALFLFALLFVGSKVRVGATKEILNKNFNLAFLFYVGIGPFLLTLLLSIFLGIKLRAGWGMPLMSLWGIILLTVIQPTLSKTKIHGFICAIFLFLGILLGGYSLSLIYSSSPTSANFPGREIAQEITQIWHENYPTKLPYVAGSRWISGNIEFYSPDHPAVFIKWDKHLAPWINLHDMQKKGAVFVWNISDNEKIPPEIQKRFPLLEKISVLKFSWLRDKQNLPPIKIGMAILPPA